MPATMTREQRGRVAMRRATGLKGNSGAIPNGAGRSQLFHGALMRAKLVKRGGHDVYEVEGYASVVDTPYEMYDMWGPYDEEIRGGAFDKSLARDDLDTAFLVNHRGVTMARTTNGSLSLWSDSTGLGSRAWLNSNRQDVRDIVSAIDDGLIDEMSFAFYLDAGGWNESYDKFTIFEADIHRGDVSAVNYGANPYTSIAARASVILGELDHLPDGAARAAMLRLRSRLAPSMRALTSMDTDESVNEVIAALDATLDSASDLVVGLDPATVSPEVAQALDLLTGAEALADQLMDMLGIDDPDDTDSDERSAKRVRPDIGTPAIVPSVPLAGGRSGMSDWPVIDETGDDERAGGGNPADATHGSYSGAHTHMHAANGAQGSDEMHTHAHSHNGDGNHGHGHANSAELPQWEADLIAQIAQQQLGDQGPGAVASGMSTELLAELTRLDDEYEQDHENV